MARRRIAFAVHALDDILAYATEFLKALRSRGCDVLCLAEDSADPALQSKCTDFLAEHKITFRPLEGTGGGHWAPAALRTLMQYKTVLSEWRADVLLCSGLDVAAYAVPAARRAGVTRCVTICSELPDFLRPTVSRDGSRMARLAVQFALKSSDHIVVHNAAHQRSLQDAGLIHHDQAQCVVPGWGVDLDTIAAQPMPDLKDGLVFAMVARQQSVRGCLNYLDAIQRIAPSLPNARFVFQAMAGKRDFDISACGPLQANFDYRPANGSCQEAIQQSHVFVYPSHSEGLAHELQVALAVGRPIITTDVPGCRDSVDETVNGILIERGNVKALGDAMLRLASRPQMWPALARASRAKAKSHFGQTEVHEKLIEIVGA